MSKANKDFDLDLQYGQAGENWLRWLGTDQARVEVKTERDTWKETGNACFEVQYDGKPSGINATQSDIWIHLFALNGEVQLAFVFPVLALRLFLRHACHLPGCKMVRGGDGNKSYIMLVPIEHLHRVARY